MSRTIADITQAKDELLETGLDVLRTWKVPDLRKALSNVGITAVVREPQETPISIWKAKKADLMDTLETCLVSHKASKEASVTAEDIRLPEFDIKELSRTAEYQEVVKDSINKFKKAVVELANLDSLAASGEQVDISSLDKAEGDLFSVGTAVGTYCLGLTRYRDGESYSASAKANARREISDMVKDGLMSDPGTPARVRLGIDGYMRKFDLASRAVLKSGNVYGQKGRKYKDATYREQRSHGRSAIDPTQLLQWADITLKEPKADWRDISVALALVTGRRMVEVHCMGSIRVAHDSEEYPGYREVDGKPVVGTEDFYGPDNTLWFEGQAKAKGQAKAFFEKYPGYAVPSLVDSETAVAAWDRLRKDRGYEYPAQVNNYVARPLATRVQHVLKSFLPELDRKVTYHTLRDIYALVSNQRFNPVPDRAVLFACVVLGHERDIDNPYAVLASGTSLSYVDELELV